MRPDPRNAPADVWDFTSLSPWLPPAEAKPSSAPTARGGGRPPPDLIARLRGRLPSLDPVASALRVTYADGDATVGAEQRETLVIQVERSPSPDVAEVARQALVSLVHTLPGLRAVERGPLLFADGAQGRFIAYGLDPAGVPLTQVHVLRVDAEPERHVLMTVVWTLPYGVPHELLLQRLADFLTPGDKP